MSSDFELRSGAQQLFDMWQHKVWSDKPLGPAWLAAFQDWIEKFGFSRVADALWMASAPRYSRDGERLPPDIRDIPRYAAVEKADDREPGIKACYLVRGRMRLKYFYEEGDNEVFKLLKRLKRAGVSEAAMHDAVDDTDTLEDCFAAMGLDRVEFRIAMGHPIADLSVKKSIFVSTEDREWPIWNAYMRRTTGKDVPIARRGGWYFPSRLPPSNDLVTGRKPRKR